MINQSEYAENKSNNIMVFKQLYTNMQLRKIQLSSQRNFAVTMKLNYLNTQIKKKKKKKYRNNINQIFSIFGGVSIIDDMQIWR